MKTELVTRIKHIPEAGDHCYIMTCNGHIVEGRLGDIIEDKPYRLFDLLFGNDERGYGHDSALTSVSSYFLYWDRNRFQWFYNRG